MVRLGDDAEHVRLLRCSARPLAAHVQGHQSICAQPSPVNTAWNPSCFQVASTLIRTAEQAHQQQSEENQADQTSQEIRFLQRCARLPAARLGETQGPELRVPLPRRGRYFLRRTRNHNPDCSRDADPPQRLSVQSTDAVREHLILRV